MKTNNHRKLVGFLNEHLAKVGKKYIATFQEGTKAPNETNEKLLFEILNRNKDTEFGKEHNFSSIHSLDDYRKEVPLSDYADYEKAIERMENGEEDILFKGKPVYFNATSGTTGRSKHIPISKEQKKAIDEKGQAQIIPYLEKKNGCYDKNHRRILALMANADISYTKDHTPVGDVVSMMLTDVNKLMGLFFTTPLISLSTNEIHDRMYVHLLFGLQDTDIYLIMSAYLSEINGMVSYLYDNKDLLLHDIAEGKISSSVKISTELKQKLEEKLSPNPKRAEELKTILSDPNKEGVLKRIWPHLTTLSGVGSYHNFLRPGTELARFYLGKEGHIYYGAYSSSESLMAQATDYDTFAYTPATDVTFLEFLPIDENGDVSSDKTLLLEDLEVGKNYETVITNQSGFYRYRMHDVIRVVSKDGKMPLLEVIGRNQILLDIMGEKLTFEQADYAFYLLGKKLGRDKHPIFGYAAKALAHNDSYCFYIEAGNPDSLDKESLAKELEEALKEAAPDVKYAFENENLGHVEIKLVKLGTFSEFNHNENHEESPLRHAIKDIKAIRNADVLDFFEKHRI